MRLIDADAFVTTLEKIAKEDGSNYFHLDEVTQELFGAPTIEAEPVKCAKWEYIADFGDGNCYGHCSNCKTQHKAQNRTALIGSYRYCRWCGAKMDGGADNG